MRRWGLALALLALSCSSHNRGQNNNNTDSGLVLSDDGGLDMSMSSVEDAMMSLPIDLLGLESGTAYGDLAIDRDASGCAPGQSGTTCPSPVPANAGCGPVEDCAINGGTGNGLDDDCNGKVDDGCTCTPGDVRRCFVGPPGKRGVGGCTDGTETCIGVSEFGAWGPCVGAIGPSPETCDGLDNDCDGCPDDGLCCGGGGVLCPAPNDPHLSPVAPFGTKMYHGADFFMGNATSWTWTVEGGPCDALFGSAGFTPQTVPPPQSFKVTGGNTSDPSIYFSLSGDYTVTMTVVDDKGQTYSCKWVQHVEGPGVRFELCWDHQGTDAQGGADLDLHVHRSGTTTSWFGATTLVDTTTNCKNGGKCTPGFLVCDTATNKCAQRKITANPDDCFWSNCTAGEYFPGLPENLYPGNPQPNWGYTNESPDTACSGSKYGMWWDMLGYCHNPRLDLDNIVDAGAPENTNIDNPNDGDKFRAMVHYYGAGGYYPCTATCPTGSTCDNASGNCKWNSSPFFVETSSAVSARPVHPIVNIYCGGSLKASYGVAPAQVSGFDTGVANAGGEMWRVADVTAKVALGVTTDCTISALHPPATNAGYWVTSSSNTDTSY